MNLPEFKADLSSYTPGIFGAYFAQDGQRVPLEHVFKSGFIVTPEDCPLVVTLLADYFKAKGEEGLSR